jgi:hypothetical protein
MDPSLFRRLIEGISPRPDTWSERSMQDHDLDDFVAFTDEEIAAIAALTIYYSVINHGFIMTTPTIGFGPSIVSLQTPMSKTITVKKQLLSMRNLLFRKTPFLPDIWIYPNEPTDSKYVSCSTKCHF